MRHLIAAALALCLAGAAQAYDLALVIGNEDYDHLPEAGRGDDVDGLVENLRRAGFEVIEEKNARRPETHAAVERFVERAPGADRLLVVLNGQFLRSDRDFFLLPRESREPTIDAAPRRALAVSTLMSVLAEHPDERAVMVLGAGRRSGEASPYLQRGLVSLPQDPGFVMIGGAADVTGGFVRDVLARPGGSFEARDLRRLDVAVQGLDGSSMTFIPEGRDLREVTVAEDPPRDGAGNAERDYWEAVRTFDTERAYVNYLDRYPDGVHAREAGRRLDEIRRDPVRRARAGETALDLGREDRRRVQAGLSVLGYDPRGIDGVFGPGTRSAIEAWQREQDLDSTGYLTAEQLARLSEQAGRRSAEIEAQAEAQRAEARRLDAAWWARTGEGGGAEGLRAYLERYPRRHPCGRGAGAAGGAGPEGARGRGFGRRPRLGPGTGGGPPPGLPPLRRGESGRSVRRGRPRPDRGASRGAPRGGYLGEGPGGRRGGAGPHARHAWAGRGPAGGVRLRARHRRRRLRRGYAPRHTPLSAEPRAGTVGPSRPRGGHAHPCGFDPEVRPRAGGAGGPRPSSPCPLQPRSGASRRARRVTGAATGPGRHAAGTDPLEALGTRTLTAAAHGSAA